MVSKLTAVFVGLALALAACGGAADQVDSAAASSTSSGASTTVATTTTTTTTIAVETTLAESTTTSTTSTTTTAPPVSWGFGSIESRTGSDSSLAIDASVPPCEPVQVATLDVVPQWRVGDRRRLIQSSAETNQFNISAPVETEVELEVVEEVGSGWLMRWSTQGIDLGQLSSLLTPDLEQELQSVSRFDVEYHVDRWGFFVEVTNIAELTEQAELAYDLVFDLIPDEMLSAEQAAAMRELLFDPVFIANTYAEGPGLYHSLYGELIDVGQLVEYEGEMPSPLVGTPVSALTVVEALSSDGANGCAELTSTTNLDVAEAVDELLSVLIDDTMSDVQAGMIERELANLSVVDVAHYAYDIESGWIRQVEAERVVEVGSETQREVIVITDLGPIDPA